MNMTTFSIDTNILIALWDESNTLNIAARRSLDSARAVGQLAIAAPVYSELMGHPSRSAAEIDGMLAATGIEVDWNIDEAIWRAAGVAFHDYVHRRLTSAGSYPRRILTDFLIGAHSVVRGSTLLTLDLKIYAAAFPGLRIQSF
jgi:predicted nucleic acid-binding protein